MYKVGDPPSAAFEIKDCDATEHHVTWKKDKFVFTHTDGSKCSKMRKMEWYELQDTMEPMTKLFSE